MSLLAELSLELFRKAGGKVRLPFAVTAVAITLLLWANSCYSHSGGLNKKGCHLNHKTGDYHCHGKGGGGSISGYKVEDNLREKEKGNSRHLRVSGVADGDTFSGYGNGEEYNVRLYGIDAPEDGQAFGNRSREHLKELVAGKDVEIKIVGHDKYGRAVALVYADGVNVNEALVREGAAWVYPKYCRLIFCSEWKEHQDAAKSVGAELWRDKDATPPWEYRRQ